MERLPERLKITFTVENGGSDLRLALRIPEWGTSPCFTGLSASDMFEKDDYIYIKPDWQEKLSFVLELKERIRIMEADPRVREDIGRVALTRGSVVYCMEECDNGPELWRCSVSRTLRPSDIRTEKVTIGNREVTALLVPGMRRKAEEGGALYRPYTGYQTEETVLKFIPYYCWANRGENGMQVFVRTD